MTASCVCITQLLCRAATMQTIGQECESSVALAGDARAHHSHDSGIVLLADALIGREDAREMPYLQERTGR
jgi:hypothetical protein